MVIFCPIPGKWQRISVSRYIFYAVLLSILFFPYYSPRKFVVIYAERNGLHSLKGTYTSCIGILILVNQICFEHRVFCPHCGHMAVIDSTVVCVCNVLAHSNVIFCMFSYYKLQLVLNAN